MLDAKGKRMSKSAGNGVDPLEMIDQYGADTTRLSLILLTKEGQDTRLSPDKIDQAWRFGNKVWNASRFVLMSMEGDRTEGTSAEAERVEDRWILSRLAKTIESVTTDLAAHAGPATTPRSLQKGVAANLLNPHPYLFWLTVGAPILWHAWATSPVNAAGFLVAMYGCLIGSKMLVALLVGRGRTVLTSRAYVLLVRTLGIILFVFALLFLRDGLRYLSDS